MRKKTKLVYGVGINDADYPVTKHSLVDGKWIHSWACPYYLKWKSMIQRCYSERCWIKHPTYKGCQTVPEWHYFMTFRAWMAEQDWEGKHLDKDILFPGNKIYGPDNCVFLDHYVNTFFLECKSARGEWPTGVSYSKKHQKFVANCNDVVTRKYKHLGLYDNPDEAHKAWLAFKLEQAYILAAQQTDARVAKALIERYENYESIK